MILVTLVPRSATTTTPMFTGIIEHVGTVTTITHGSRESTLMVDLGPLHVGTELGDSIATDGICLTVAKLDGSRAQFHASGETRAKTTLGAWATGKTVNLERALAFGDRLGGHLVSGHVDGIGRLVERRKEGDSERFTFVCPDGDLVKTVEKGSITIDGISLTSWDCRGARFSVAVVPHTLAHTTLGTARPGALLNLEQDVISRWVERLMPGHLLGVCRE